ncbi:MAG: DUF928 domain-containing protein [Cyanobacteria bacterium J06631_9]
MKHNRFAATLGAVALLLGAAWSQGGAAVAVGFTPPADNAAPRSGTGGASRGGFFVPPAENSSPQSSTGGASRGGFFVPPAENSSPQSSTGGASRGSFFAPPTDNSSPQQGATGGASRTIVTLTGDHGLDGNAVHGNSYGATNSISALSHASMMAVMPESFYGTTLEARPTILVYVPASDANEAVFSLKDEARELIYQMTVAVPQNGGIVAVELPEAAPELAVNANYQWYLAMMLDGALSPASPFVDGWVKRIEPTETLANSLSEGEGLSDVAALGANGVWYDTVAQLAELQQVQSSDEIAGHWYELLESVGLSEVATAPLVL